MQKYITSYQEYMTYWKDLQDKLPLNLLINEVRCKFCYSNNIIRYGHFKGMQRWWCKDCQRKFADNGATPYMKTNTEQVCTALGMYYEGISLNAICRQLQQRYHNYSSNSTVYEWVRKYTASAIKNSEEHIANVSDTWLIAVDTTRIAKEEARVWDVMDADTRFILVSKIATNQMQADIKSILQQAVQKANKLPRIILTYGQSDLLDIKSLLSDPVMRQIEVKKVQAGDYDPVTNAFLGAIRGRAKILRVRKDIEHARFILSGWQEHHNYFRLDSQLGNRTPSQLTGIDERLDPNWLNILKQDREIIERWRSNYYKAVKHS